MDQKLHVLFERALGMEPAPPAGELAREAIAGGAALRRRRRLVTGGAGACLVTIAAVLVALNLTPASREPVPPAVAAGALMPSADATCARQWGDEPVDIRVFLRQEITDQQRLDLRDALRSDPLVRSVTFQSRDEAYARFKEMYRNSPDLVHAVKPEQMPESFQVALTRAKDFSELMANFHDRDGVDQILGNPCPASSDSGEGE
ncbi:MULTISPECIES: permease-like cell division protein FtsX [unclassified Micromonospora]|uniref:permease-like cell division protein FtsX n=1 Tax=unclassified Micromonospora TaxID=2617518 RepID=UPI001C2336F9|nr:MULTISPECIES: permease-like cell division protein FtsX [unclassified Micromonospora]MBU8857585.1 permease-like cell division protein FtsX [Micromonospora sp. WMMB482]MDM4777824.1 permease-like cell division protein FtsX [Micromonospora sp. b486]MDM4783211.1 permease-like cell division protein FtsX [Micromonospora sp. b486]